MLHALVLAAATTLPAGPAKHIRSMTFSFHMDEQGGTYFDYVSGGYDGTIQVNVLATGPQKTLLLRMEQRVPLYHRFEVAPADCVVFPDGHIDFDQKNSQLSTPELTLARFLARDFINPDLIDSHNHWNSELKSSALDIATDFTITKNENGILSIDELRELKNTTGRTHTTGQIVYDMNHTIPISIHEQSVTQTGGPQEFMRLDYSLSSDSMGARR